MQQIGTDVVNPVCSQIAGIICMGFLISLSVMDIKYRKLPGTMLAMAGILAFVYCIVFERRNMWLSIAGLLVGMFFVFLSKVTREGIGYGDSLLFCILGLYLGIWRFLELLVISWLLVALAAMFMLVIQRFYRRSAFPMVPFIAVGFAAIWITELAAGSM